MISEPYTLGGGQSLLARPPEDASRTDLAAGGLAGALARRQRSALAALADLPPTAAPSRLYLQAQQRARCALGRHERACASGYRPHLRAAATARAVLAAAGGLAPDAAAAAAERAAVEQHKQENSRWKRLLEAAHATAVCGQAIGKSEDSPNAGLLRQLGAALYALVTALDAIPWEAVLHELITASRASGGASAAEARQQATACGRVLSEAAEGACVSAPVWLLAQEAGRMLPARAALLLHCHVAVARPAVEYAELVDKKCVAEAASAAAEGQPVDIMPGGVKCGVHMARAAALADALLRYWRPPPSVSGAGGSCSAAARDGAEPPPPPPPPLLCSDLTVLASVVSAAQTLALQCAPNTREAAGGATGTLAALTRPAVLLRVAHVLSTGLSSTPATVAQLTLHTIIGRHYVVGLRRALTKLPGSTSSSRAQQALRGVTCGGDDGEAAPGPARRPAAAAEPATDGEQLRQQQRVLGQLRAMYEEELATERKNLGHAQADLDAREQRLRRRGRGGPAAPSGAAGGAGANVKGRDRGGGTDHGGREGEEDPQQQQQQQQQQYEELRRKGAFLIRSEQVCQVGERLFTAIFNTPLAAPLPATAVAAPVGPPAPPPGAPRVLFLLPDGCMDELEISTVSAASGEQWLSSEEVRASFRWAAAESAGRAALARTMVGALAPCWEAAAEDWPRAANGGAGRPAGTSPAAAEPAAALQAGPAGSYSPHSSLVLQGAPAICYSLARTAAVNMVLELVARGLAAATAAAEMGADVQCAPAGAGADAGAAPAITPAVNRRPPEGDADIVAHAEAVAARFQQLLPQYQRACGWPLVVSLSSSGESAQAVQAGGLPAELLEQLPRLSVAPQDVASLLRQRACVVATWAASPATSARPHGGGGGRGSTLQEAVIARVLDAVQFTMSDGRLPTLAGTLDIAMASHPLRAARLLPVGELQTTCMAVTLAKISHQPSTAAAAASPPRELVVVPILSPKNLVRPENDAVRRRLLGVTAVVLRHLTEPAALLHEGQLLVAPRVLRPDWQLRLPLVLNRCVCRLVDLGFQTMGYTLSDLSPPQPQQQQQQRQPGGADNTSSRGGQEARAAQAAQRLNEAAVEASNRADAHAARLSVRGFYDAGASAARARADMLRQLVDGLGALSNADAPGMPAACDGVEQYLSVSIDEHVSGGRGELWRLVMAGWRGGAGGGGGGGGGVSEPSPQLLQLLVAEAAPGRPTELLAGCEDATRLWELD